ncbi:2-isopropylmalate synthase [Nonomuraea sp. NBC_01738]|uniref:2-isopropylmalate synthase n=1 Tax=Nonomuraea sp. NBC_01738 TaxID=2976003 RepID=UPI002E0F951F|nr:2-isopropylmalate synthase [Nonomuraea sp. NBC_01738]
MNWNPQTPSGMPYQKYRNVRERVDVPLIERAWPARTLESAPLWVPVDLRDGNQALAEPMDTARKRRLFDLLVNMGFKEIEVGYPSASQTDFDFVRHLATSGAVPDDVTVVVFTAARADLVERTFASIDGLPKTVVHLYTATAPVWRDVVLGRGRAEVKGMIRSSAEQMLRLAGDGTRFQFSPEVFNLTEPDFVLEICDELTELWDASPDRPVIHNLPATVEVATPNVYADQIEYMSRHLARRDAVILSIHPHNDRGTGVACAELAVLAGAQRVEGCLFGNGERTGNVDLVTLALNLYAQGVDPMIDFSDLDTVLETVEHCNRLPVHPRHPYGGELVYTAFSGTHQDAISKGLAAYAGGVWQVPYLPIDPADVGRSYEAIIRVNSQSGKGGIAHLLKTGYGLDLPPRMRADFSQVVQRAGDSSGQELTQKDLWELFRAAYLDDPFDVGDWSATGDTFTCALCSAQGAGPLAALVAVLAANGIEADILHYAEHATTTGQDSPAIAYAEVAVDGVTRWGAGQDTSVLAASVQAVLAAVARARR